MYSSHCEYHIKATNPDCKNIKCAKFIDGFLFDLKTSRIPQSLVFTSENRTFYVNICGPSNYCNDRSATVCEKTSNRFRTLGDLQSQHLNYDERTKMLTVKSHYGSRKRCKLDCLLFNF